MVRRAGLRHQNQSIAEKAASLERLSAQSQRRGQGTGLVADGSIGMALGIFALTVYLILGTIVSGYIWAFLQNAPLLPGDYFRQIAQSLRPLDFVLLAIKTWTFGSVIAIVTCYHGLAQPLRLEQVAGASVQALTQAGVLCVLVDALFIMIYLVV